MFETCFEFGALNLFGIWNLEIGIFLFFLPEQTIHELNPVENLQIANLLAYADIFHRDLELVGDADSYAARSDRSMCNRPGGCDRSNYNQSGGK